MFYYVGISLILIGLDDIPNMLKNHTVLEKILQVVLDIHKFYMFYTIN